MVRAQRGASLSVGELLNEAQRGTAAAHHRYAKALWERVEDDYEAAFSQLVHAAKLFMSVPEVRGGGRELSAVVARAALH
jgi:hypothetical protein